VSTAAEEDLARHGGKQRPSLVVMAAGIGSRYGGLKQVEPVGPSGEIILDYSVYDAIRAGFGRVVFVIRKEIEPDFRDAVGRRIEERVDTSYSFQELSSLPGGFDVPKGRVKPWGTGHAILSARDQVQGEFAAVNADDFYGPGAFSTVGRHLAGRRGADTGDTPEYCMAGYELGNTLSEHGYVSRGVCDLTEDGFLARVVEREKIERFAGEIKYETADSVWVGIPGDTTVSMNIWGFDCSFFSHLDAAFRRFMKSEGGSRDSEFYLPAVVNRLIEDGVARVRVLPTSEQWFGITYREDISSAREAIRSRIESGVYPEKLWT
jgi:NDP-sugar pyrophosphorylase family protein